MQGKKRAKRAKRSRAKTKHDFNAADFVNSVWGVMQKQAEENKTLRMLHARLEPEWNGVVEKIHEMLAAKGNEETTKRVEQICEYGSKAVRPLIDVLLKVTKQK